MKPELRCRACGARLPSEQAPCRVCGVTPDSGKSFWRTFWWAMGISALLCLAAALIVVYFAPRLAPHLFESGYR